MILKKLKGIAEFFGKGIRYFIDSPPHIALAILSGAALFLELLIESLSRHSLVSALSHIVTSPLMFFFNIVIILFTLSLCLLVKRRITAFLVIFVLWLTLGVANCIVLSYRSSPLSAIDFLIIKSAFGMTTLYFSWLQIIVVGLLILAVLAGLVIMFIKSRRSDVCYKKSLLCVFAVGLSVFLLNFTYTSLKVIKPEKGEIADTYNKYGFAYCFSRSLLSQGVDRPDGYSKDKVNDLLSGLNQGDSTGVMVNPDMPPNIIFVQLESFFDVARVNGVNCTEDPIPNFSKLRDEGISGLLGVSSIGGSTANIEFEVLTGMNIDHFGFGEFPYTTVLKNTPCESMAHNLNELGYASHALHNYIATFYDRNLVYANLGFDTFTPIEMMPPHEKSSLNWAKDTMLTGEVLSALDSTEGQDMVFAVSVQGHGRYPEASYNLPEETLGASLIDSIALTSPNATEESIYWQYAYYISQIREMDDFVGQLVEALAERGEPTVAVFYGDHLPAIPLQQSDLNRGNMYQTEYAIWSNIPLADEGEANTLDRDLEAYRLSAYIMSLLGVSNGDITTLHQHELATGEDHSDTLNMLEYAQLYDKEEIEFERADMVFGTRPVYISDIVTAGKQMRVTGGGFNEYSVILVDGKKKTTTFIDENTLEFEGIFEISYESVEVAQITSDGVVLATASMAE